MTPVYLLLASFVLSVLRHWIKAHKDSQRTYGPKPVLAPTPSPPPKPKPKFEHRTAAQVIEPYPLDTRKEPVPDWPWASSTEPQKPQEEEQEDIEITGERCRMTQQGSPGAPLRAPGPRIHGGAKHVGLGRALKDSFGPGWCHVKHGFKK